MSCFMSVIKDMISEDKEYKRITSNRKIQEIKDRNNGYISQTTKEFIDKYGVKGFENASKIINSVIPSQFFIYNILISATYNGCNELNQEYLEGNAFLTFKDAIEGTYKEIKAYMEQFPNSKFSIEVNDIEGEEDLYRPYKIILVERFTKTLTLVRTYSIERTLITIFPHNDLIVPNLTEGDKVYEL